MTISRRTFLGSGVVAGLVRLPVAPVTMIRPRATRWYKQPPTRFP